MPVIAELLGYARQRLLRVRILALISFVTLAACVPGWIAGDAAAGTGMPAGLFAALPLAALLVAQCRLIDDLADLPVDRVRHPERVLVRARSRRPFVLAAAGSALPVLVLLDGPAARLAWVLLLAALLVWYFVRTPPDPQAPAPDRVVLLKYPAFVLLIAGCVDCVAGWAAAAVVYAVVVFVDELDRPRAGTAAR